MSLRSLLFSIFFSLTAFLTFAKKADDGVLRPLDSLAFQALESNSPDMLEKANAFLEKALQYDPSFYRVNAYTLLGIIYKNRGFYVTSLDYYLKSYNEAVILKDDGRKSACLNNIGAVYQLQGKFDQAIEYFNRSLQIEKKLSNPLQTSIRYFNLGDCYKELDSLDLALNFFNNSLIIEKKFNNAEGIAYAKIGIADVYERYGNVIDAKRIIVELENKLSANLPDLKILYHLIKAKIFLQEGNSQAAENELKLAQSTSENNKIRTHLLEIFELQISILENRSDWKAVASKYKEYVKLNEELNSLSIKNQLDDLAYQNELKRKELEIKLVQEERDLAKKNERLEKDLRNFEQRLVIFIAGVLLIIVAIVVFTITKYAKNAGN
ncbi:MAG: tetratricopeptide repeat protein [Bacteroidetes bacterium]|nr:MAG: tetratricopeptide repeat protein [Bacteroidota bacterium]